MDKPTENNMLVELTPIVTSRIRHGSKGDVKVFLDKLSKKLKIKIGGHIGSGWFGYAYALPGNKVLKLTADGTEYLNAKKLIGEKWNHIVNVYEAYALKEPYDGVYAIIMERIKQPPNLGAMMDHLKKHINIITNKPSKFNKDGSYSYFSEIIYRYGEGKITDEQINYYKSELKKIDPKLEKLFTQVLSMAAELSANDITAIQDIHGDNVGMKNGKLALLDIGSVDEDIETEKDLELTENKVDETKVTGMLRRLDDNMESFVQKIAKILKIQPKKIKQLGRGGYGYAFEIPGNKVMKVTADVSEYIHALELKGKNNKHIINVYDVYEIAEPYINVYVIISEKLKQDKSIQSGMNDIYEWFHDMKESSGFPWEYVSDFVSDIMDDGIKKYDKVINQMFKDINPKSNDFSKQLINVLVDASKNNINIDFHDENFGYKSNGNLALLDLGIGKDSDKEIPQHKRSVLSINELTHKLTNNKKSNDIVKFLKDKKFKNPKSKMFLYHGTKINPKDFNLRDDYNGEDSNGWSGDLPEGYLFLTTDINEAKAYGQYVIPCELESYSHIFFKVNSDAPSQVFDDDFGISAINTHVKVNQFGFWDEYMNSGKANLIIKGNRNKWTIISPIENVIPRIDLANEFYNGNKELKEENNSYSNMINNPIPFDDIEKIKDKPDYRKKAAGILLFAKNSGRFLLLRRSDGDHINQWSIPGGGLDKGETPTQAMVREVKEEVTNIENPLEDIKNITMVFKNDITNEHGEDYYYYNFLGKVDYEFTPELNNEHNGFVWCNEYTLPENLHYGLEDLLIKLKILKNDPSENKETLNEDFQSTKEIRKLSSDIIKLLADKNLDNVNQNLNDKIKFNGVKLSDVNPSNYIKLNQFIQNYSLYIELVENITNLYKGNYASFIKERGVTRAGDIELYYHDNLIDSLKDELKYGNGKIDNLKLYTIFYFKFANNLMHELQHVYDDYRSLGKALKSQDVYDTKYNKASSNSKIINLQQAKDYLNLPHEIWARFTQAIDRIYFYSLDFNDKGVVYEMYPMEKVAKEFKKQFKGFDILTDDMKRRLIKAVIQFWHFEQDDLKKDGKLNENNLLANNNYIDIPEAKLKYWEMVFKKYPGNMSTYALQIISSIKKNHNKATPKQNMYIQKALRGDNNWGNKN